jgi:hypothetical protein
MFDYNIYNYLLSFFCGFFLNKKNDLVIKYIQLKEFILDTKKSIKMI